MARAYLFLILGVVANTHLWGQRDPAFNKIPLDSWLAEQNQPRFRFTLNLPRAIAARASAYFSPEVAN